MIAVVVYTRNVELKPTTALRDGVLRYPTEHLFL